MHMWGVRVRGAGATVALLHSLARMGWVWECGCASLPHGDRGSAPCSRHQPICSATAHTQIQVAAGQLGHYSGCAWVLWPQSAAVCCVHGLVQWQRQVQLPCGKGAQCSAAICL